MFTGIVETLGTLVRSQRQGNEVRLTIATEYARKDAKIGESIAVNGVCLTVTGSDGDRLDFDVSEETMRKSTVADWQQGRRLHLERALALGERLGGHLMYGHVDGTAEVVELRPAGEGAELTVRIPENLLVYLIPKGSLALDGVSLTAAELDDPLVMIALVPHTLAQTTLGELRPGDRANLEVDVLGKYVRRVIELSGR